ncbi:MAG: hypothetical protein ABW185_11830 [Sedimenticola sp.]
MKQHRTIFSTMVLTLALTSAHAADPRLQVAPSPLLNGAQPSQVQPRPSANPRQNIQRTPRTVAGTVQAGNAGLRNDRRRTVKPLTVPIILTPVYRQATITARVYRHVKISELKELFTDLNARAARYESGIDTVSRIQTHCAEKSYSIPDQAAAGCNGNETLNQCMEKLVHHCLETHRPVSITGQSRGPRTLEESRNAARVTAAMAKALSKKLADYARQAEQHANAWK